MKESNFLTVENLSVDYNGKPAVRGINMELNAGEILGIVGESGSGKTTVLRSIINLLDKNGNIISGKVKFKRFDLLKLPYDELKKLRGKEISMIFQYPEQALDPLMKVGDVFFESIKSHNRMVSKADAYLRAEKIIRELNFEDPQRIVNSYPYELSGGMCQRVTIGLAMANEPDLLLADEPTSAIDVKSQQQVIEILMAMRKKHGTALMLITHNMGLVAKMADKIGVMCCGRIVEWGSKDEVLKSPRHPYTKALIASVPKIECVLPDFVEISYNNSYSNDNLCRFINMCDKSGEACKNLVVGKCVVGENHWYLCCKAGEGK